MTRHKWSRWSAWLVAALLVVSACSSASDDAGGPDGAATTTTFAEPDVDSPNFVVNVTMTDEGYEPHTIFLPVGRHVRLILRNLGTHEHHYRVEGLIPTQLRWYLYPEIGEDELLAMSDEELAALGIGGDIDDIEHILHHLTPDFVPIKPASAAGIRPLGTEVHGYAQAGSFDVIEFFPLNVGEFVVQDVLYPEITGKVVVFDASS